MVGVHALDDLFGQDHVNAAHDGASAKCTSISTSIATLGGRLKRSLCCGSSERILDSTRIATAKL